MHSGSDLNAPALWRNGNKYLSGLPDRTPVHFSGKRPYPAHESAGYRPQPFLPWRKFRRRKQHRRNMCKSNTQAAALPEYSSPGKPFRNQPGSESKQKRGRHRKILHCYKAPVNSSSEIPANPVLEPPFGEQPPSTWSSEVHLAQPFYSYASAPWK